MGIRIDPWTSPRPATPSFGRGLSYRFLFSSILETSGGWQCPTRFFRCFMMHEPLGNTPENRPTGSRQIDYREKYRPVTTGIVSVLVAEGGLDYVA
jgi:hypothetical protein